MRRRDLDIAVAAALLLLAATLPSCPKPEATEVRMTDLVRVLKERSAGEAPVPLRYNPVECGCPPFELKAGGRWVRVKVVKSAVPDLPPGKFESRCAEDLKQGDARRYGIGFSLASAGPKFCANGTPYFLIALTSEGGVPE
jgi:hypothetical protein